MNLISTVFLFQLPFSFSLVFPLSSNRPVSLLMAEVAAQSPTSASFRASKGLEFLNLIGRLKGQLRTGWVYSKVNELQRVESVADHSWRMSMAAFLFSDDPLIDVGKMIRLAVVHDMAECITGDIAPADKVSPADKRQREANAVATITNTLGHFCSGGQSAVIDLIHEYETRESAEAVAVKDLDLLEMIVQADEYEQTTGLNLETFFDGTRGRFKTPQVKSLADELEAQRSARRLNAGDSALPSNPPVTSPSADE